MVERAEHYLADLEQPKRLSEVVLAAQDAGETLSLSLRYWCFLVMDYSDEQDSPEPEKLPVYVLKTDTQQFWLSTVAGDDVVLFPKQNRKEHQHAS